MDPEDLRRRATNFPVSVMDGTHSGWLLNLVKFLSLFARLAQVKNLHLLITNVNS